MRCRLPLWMAGVGAASALFAVSPAALASRPAALGAHAADAHGCPGITAGGYSYSAIAATRQVSCATTDAAIRAGSWSASGFSTPHWTCTAINGSATGGQFECERHKHHTVVAFHFGAKPRS